MMVRVFKHFVSVQVVLLAVVEAGMFIGALYLGYALRFIGGDFAQASELVPILSKAVVFAAIMLASMLAFGLYQRDVILDGLANLFRYLASFVTGLIIMIMTFYLLPQLFLGRGVLALTALFSFLGLILTRAAILRLVSDDLLKKRILVLGTGTRVTKLEQLLGANILKHKFILIGYLPMGTGVIHSVNPEKVLKDSSSLISIATKHNVDEIIVGVRDRRGGIVPMPDLLECKLEGINVIDLSSFFERETGHVQLDSLNPSWMVYSDGFCRTSSRNTIKRAFDILASAALMLLTFPVMVLTALLILLETGRPIFYRQVRVGECGHLFDVYKFRSMRIDAERGVPQWASKDDSRITRVGQVIRTLRIDELPQIFNVLRGHMSFVGPRPERPYFVQQLAKELPYYASRHSVKPGITGWAQINYPYGASVEDAREKLQYDLYYAKNHSLFLDMIILMQTVQVVLFGKGAR